MKHHLIIAPRVPRIHIPNPACLGHQKQADPAPHGSARLRARVMICHDLLGIQMNMLRRMSPSRIGIEHDNSNIRKLYVEVDVQTIEAEKDKQYWECCQITTISRIRHGLVKQCVSSKNGDINNIFHWSRGWSCLCKGFVVFLCLGYD